jgi:hypothetical protein
MVNTGKGGIERNNLERIFEHCIVLTAVAMKSSVFWDITRCSPLHAGFLLDLFFGPGNGGDIFLPNVPLTLNGLHGGCMAEENSSTLEQTVRYSLIHTDHCRPDNLEVTDIYLKNKSQNY